MYTLKVGSSDIAKNPVSLKRSSVFTLDILSVQYMDLTFFTHSLGTRMRGGGFRRRASPMKFLGQDAVQGVAKSIRLKNQIPPARMF